MSQPDKPRQNQEVKREGDAYLLKGRLDDIEREQAEQKVRDQAYKDQQLQNQTRQVAFDGRLVVLTFGLVILGIAGTAISVWQSRISKDAADAAKVSAEAATQAVQQSKRALEIDQRAWLTIEFSLDREPAELKGFSMHLHTLNRGKTPAINRVARSWSDVRPPPANIDWSRAAATPLRPLHPSTIPSVTPVITGFLDTTNLKKYLARELRLFVVVRVSYCDVFDQQHFVQSCASRIYGEPLNRFYGCPGGESMEVMDDPQTQTPCQP